MKAAIVDSGRSARLKTGLKSPRSRTGSQDCPDQVQLYLNRLTALVPTAPKHRRLSRLEVIQCVIDYICDLEDTLLGRHLPGEQERPCECDDRDGGAPPEDRMACEDRTTVADQENTVRTSQPSPPPPAVGS